MANTTIVNTPARREIDSSGDNAVGWVVAAIILVAVLVGGFFLLRRTNAPVAAPDTNVQVTLPSGSGSTGGTSY